MKKVMKNVLFALVIFTGFVISTNAATINFRRQQNGGGGNNNLGSMTINTANQANAITIATPTRNGFRFTGWDTDSSRIQIDNVNNTITITQTGNWNRDVYATWAQLYNITYNLAGGEVATTNPAQYATGDNITLNNPTRNGYNFDGWTGTGLSTATINVTIPTNATGARNYTATWSLANYDINIDVDGGDAITAPATYTINSDDIDIPDPTREGYDFTGWLDTDSNTNLGNGLTIQSGSFGNMNLKATWAPHDYSINYELNGGNGATSNPDTYNIEDPDIVLENPTKEGYDFAGWTGTDLAAADDNVTIASGSTGDRSYEATYTPTDYEIEYELDGGSTATNNPGGYTIESPDFTLENPTREGYEFAGWIGTDLTGPTMTVIIPNGSLGNRSYTATWEEIPAVVDDNEETPAEETEGEGTSDLDEIDESNPQTEDDVLKFIALSIVGGCGVILNKKKRYC